MMTELFRVPVMILLGIVGYLAFRYVVHLDWIATIIIAITIFVGSIDLLKDTFASLIHKKFALDYIALLAIIVGVLSREYLVASVIVLMLAGGQTLEKYAVARAKKSLTALTDRIPSSVLLWEKEDIGKKVDISSVLVGQQIFVRKGEVIPLDGLLISEDGLSDESSLTGEPYEMEKIAGDVIRSGTINVGKPMVIQVTKPDADSTYRKIVEMVKRAQDERTPFIRLADQYSTFFTVVTFVLSAIAFFVWHDFNHVLAVLVIATPCPLILATPIALMGGMNALAKRKVIVKKLASIEVLSRVTDIMFDKTGTITLGKPQVTAIDVKARSFTKEKVLSIVEAIERNSLHPLAKAVVVMARSLRVPRVHATAVEEKIGYGIVGSVAGKSYVVSKLKSDEGFAIEVREGKKHIAVIRFEDQLKDDSRTILEKLRRSGLHLSIFTGDKKESTQQVLRDLHEDITIKAECTPEDKMQGIKDLRRQGKVTAMVGDGINDAPALASSDVGLVFSNEEHTAASEAADMVFLGGNFSLVLSALEIAKRTLHIALQSIWFGIGLSIIGMILAVLGYIPPLLGALLQEIIDVSVIFNALRASR